MESHEHEMDPGVVTATLAALTGDHDEETEGDPWDDVLEVSVAKRVRILLGVGGPTQWIDAVVSDGSVQSAEYFDSWAVPDTYEIWSGSTEFKMVEEIIEQLGYDQ